jgi:hypothetical protein
MIEILRATEEDAPTILEVKQRAFSKEFELYGAKSIPPNFDSINRQIELIN